MFAKDFLALFYPSLCIICASNLLKHEDCICISCLHQTPKTDCFINSKNDVSERFWGRIQLENAAALFNFNKDGNAQKLIHQLKYEEGKNVGIFLGKQLAYAINESECFNNIDIVIPVPLHSKKQKLRGYNQSRKKRFSRWENMMNSFDLRSSKKLKGKHILLVDDVITTGSTLEACAQKLQEVEGVKVSIATIAVA